MKLISIPGIVAAASLALAPAAFAGSPDHGPHVVPNVHDPSTHGPGPRVNHEEHEGDHHGNPVPFINRIDANPALVAKLTPLLPSGVTLDAAAKGFRNEGQFIAALHAAKDLGISFTDLKNEMITGHDSLGQAIHDLKPTADAKGSAKTAEGEARADISSTRPTLADRIGANTTLLGEVTPLLPSGMKLADAASGFHSTEQFLAALHAAKDLGVSFADLKAEMIGSEHDNLAQAIHDLKPAIDAKTAAKTAAGEARADITAARPSLADRITANADLLAKITPLLPSGTKLADDAKGFNSLEQFLAALHAAKDLNVSFSALKAELTGSPRDSLAQAIHDVAPTADAAAAAKTAAGEARTDIGSIRPPDGDHDLDD
jgi:hypothetical protein